MKWLFDTDKLRPGDILFSRSPYVGKIIAKSTKGAYSHVMLYVGDSLIHAEPNGVWSKNPQRLLVDDPSRLSAYRVKEQISGEALQILENFARTKVGGLYSIPQAVSTVRRAATAVANDEQFCSRLVAQSFQAIGVNLVDVPDFCTPNQIAKSPLLEPVIDCVREASAADISFSETEDYNLQLQKETYIWLKKVRKLSERRKLRAIVAQNDVGAMVLENPSLDHVVSNYVRSTRYLDFSDIDRSRNPWRYDVRLFLEKVGSHPSPMHVVSRERAINESNIRRHEINLLAAANNAKSGLEFFGMELELAHKILDEMYEWRGVMEEAERRMHTA